MLKRYLLCLVLFLMFPLLLFAESTEIDNMDDKSVWSASTSSSASINFSTDAGVVNQSFKIEYSIEKDGYVVISRNTKTTDLSSGNAIRFFYRGTGNSNDLEIKLTDSDTDIFNVILTGITSTANWTDTQIPLHSFDNTTSSLGNQSLDFKNITNITFVIGRNVGGAGTFLLDEIELYNIAITTAIDTLVDDFEDGDTSPNTLGLVNEVNGDGNITASLTNDAAIGDTALNIAYTAADWAVALNAGNLDFSEFITQTYLKMYIKGASGGEAVTLKLEQTDGTKSSEVNVSNYVTLSTTYQILSIPLSDFAGCTDYSQVAKVTLVAPSGSGSFNVDDIRFVRNTGGAGTVKEIDAMELNTTFNSWSSFMDVNTSIDVSQVEGYTGDATRMDYSFSGGTFLGIDRNFFLNLAPARHLSFYYRETDNDFKLELNVVDDDNTKYRWLGNITPSAGTWAQVTVPLNEFNFAESGGNDDLNLKKIQSVSFAVSDKTGIGPGSGTVWLDSFTYGTIYDFKETLDQDNLLKEVKVTVNPFSPNGDGYMDETQFLFTLDAFSTVRLRLYDLRGRIVYEQSGTFPAGENTMTWDGDDRKNRIVRFGLYYYSLLAISTDGRRQQFSHVIGVVK